MKVVYLLRHGEALHNLIDFSDTFEKRRDPDLANPPLTEKGEAEANAASVGLAAQLKEHGDGELGAVICSPLRRALQTAELGLLPAASTNTKLLIFEPIGEVLNDDIWNEPPDLGDVAAASQWEVLPVVENGAVDPVRAARNSGVLDTAQSMIARAEVLWRAIYSMPADVVAVSSHVCFLFFFWNRISIANATPDSLPSFGECKFANGEIRRVKLPPPDDFQMTWEDFGAKLNPIDVSFWNRYSRRATAVNKVSNGCVLEGCFEWTKREWRFSPEDEEFDATLDDV